MKWITSAPANTMLLGEHSVVFGAPALVAALEQRIHLEITARQDSKIYIFSELANWQTSLDKLTSHPQLKFVLASLKAYKNQLKFGLNITITSEFPADWGLGSSAAIVAAFIKALNLITQNLSNNLWQDFSTGHQIILDVQKSGSGADLAASLAGGIIYFDPANKQIKPLINLQDKLKMSLIYSGYKTPTPQVLQQVANAWRKKPSELTNLYNQMSHTTQLAYQCLEQQNYDCFYQAINSYQKLMQQLGVSDPTLEKIIQHNQLNHSNPAKISGSGLGDCVISFNPNVQIQGFDNLPIKITNQGATAQQI